MNVPLSLEKLRDQNFVNLKCTQGPETVSICWLQSVFSSSASGRWVYNNTPRHIPWNRYGDPFVHVCDRNHKSRDTQNIAFAEADIVASQGGDWKVTIHNIL